MKADHNSHETGTRLPCREHPALCLSLFSFMFVPAVAGEIALGRWLTQFMPHPGLIAMLCFAPAIVVLFIFGMFIGATRSRARCAMFPSSERLSPKTMT